MILLIKGNGSSTGIIPNHVKIKKIQVKFQNNHGIKEILLFCNDDDFKLNGIKIRIDINKPITPPNLFGIDRKIA